MLKKIYKLFNGNELELKERQFQVVLFVSGIVSMLAIAEGLTVGEPEVVIPPIAALMIVMAGALAAAFKYRKIDFAAIVVGVMIIVVIFPVMFYIYGGIESGATVWFAMGIFYVFMMFSGKRMIFFLILAVTVDLLTYLTGYLHPELIIPLQSKQDVYFDSLFSVILVGISGGAVLKFQNKNYEAERTITEAQKNELEKANSSQNAFFANMSHEIRTPINSIIGLTEMILRDDITDEIRENAENVQLAGKMLLNLVNDILDLSKIEVKKMEIVPVEYKTKELFGELVDLMQVRMKEKNLDFFVDIDKRLPSVLEGDEKRIKQILLNILTNAVKYTKMGSVTLSAHGEPAKDGTVLLKISVADTGIGIKKEDLAYLYDSYRRVDEINNRKIEGNGLGLAITKQLVELMHGQITVDSIYTKGSVFTVIIEQKIVNEVPVGKINYMKKTGKENKSYYKQSFEAPEARVLIVDDNNMNLMVAQKLLSSTKMQIDLAKSGEECLRKTREKYYHIILMDYVMPGLNGVDTLKALRRQQNGLCREVPVIVLTATTYTTADQMYQKYGFDGYLEKPVQGVRLEEEILKFLPEDMIEYRRDSDSEEDNRNTIQRIASRRRKKLYITSDCVCDLPEDLTDQYNIKIMYLYVKTDHARFCDHREIGCDNLSGYLSESGSDISADSASVEEYEEFFAETLTQSEEVIHISLAKHAGKSYERAVMAARGFDHVRVIDSGHISCGQGLVVLYAAKMAQDGYSVDEISERIEKIKGQIRTSFLLPSHKILYRNGYINRITAGVCDLLRCHPVVVAKQSRLMVFGLYWGKIENARKKYIRYRLFQKWKIDPSVIIITHVGCSVKQQELIVSEIKKCIPFERIIVQKGSVSSACNAGMGTIGMSFYLKD